MSSTNLNSTKLQANNKYQMAIESRNSITATNSSSSLSKMYEKNAAGYTDGFNSNKGPVYLNTHLVSDTSSNGGAY